MWTCWECNERTLSSPGASGPFLWFLFICISQIKTATAPCIAQCCFWSMLWLCCLPPLRAVCQRDPLASLSLFLSLCLRVCASQLSVCEEMLRELQGIVLCQDSLQLRRRRGASVLRPQPLPLDERRARAVAASLSNGKLCMGTGLPEPLSHRLAQEAALVARGCSHIRICPECRRFQGIRVRPAGPPGASPSHSEESIEWEKGTNNSEPE